MRTRIEKTAHAIAWMLPGALRDIMLAGLAVADAGEPIGIGVCGRCGGMLPVFRNPHGGVARCAHCRSLDDAERESGSEQAGRNPATPDRGLLDAHCAIGSRYVLAEKHKLLNRSLMLHAISQRGIFVTPRRHR